MAALAGSDADVATRALQDLEASVADAVASWAADHALQDERVTHKLAASTLSLQHAAAINRSVHDPSLRRHFVQQLPRAAAAEAGALGGAGPETLLTGSAGARRAGGGVPSAGRSGLGTVEALVRASRLLLSPAMLRCCPAVEADTCAAAQQTAHRATLGIGARLRLAVSSATPLRIAQAASGLRLDADATAAEAAEMRCRLAAAGVALGDEAFARLWLAPRDALAAAMLGALPARPAALALAEQVGRRTARRRARARRAGAAAPRQHVS